MDTKNTTNPQGDTTDISYQVMPRADGRFTPEPEPAIAPVVKTPAPVVPVTKTPAGVPPTPPTPPVSESPVMPMDHLSGPSIWHNSWLYIVIGAVLLVVIGGAIYLMSRGDNSGENPSENTPITTTRLPKVWLQQYFNKEACDDDSICGDNADPDSDGLVNYDEFKTGTTPINSDSDVDGLADGDEVNVYKTDPVLKFTDRREIVQTNNWTDGFQIKNGYDPLTPAKAFTETRLQQILDDAKKFPLNEPTVTTLNVMPDGTPNTGTPDAPVTQGTAKNVAVSIEANVLNPAEVTINVNDTVIWLNKDSVNRIIASDPHPAHTLLPELVSGNLSANQTYSFKFTKAGTWTYHDHNNPTLKGTVIVK